MHHKLPAEGEKALYEIEPIYLKYNNILKGYAGISAIIYYAGYILYYIINRPGDISGILQSLIMIPLFLIFMLTPMYLVYTIVLKKFLSKKFKKGLNESRIITEKELYIE